MALKQDATLKGWRYIQSETIFNTGVIYGIIAHYGDGAKDHG